jgi:hypothetical protein
MTAQGDLGLRLTGPHAIATARRRARSSTQLTVAIKAGRLIDDLTWRMRLSLAALGRRLTLRQRR